MGETRRIAVVGVSLLVACGGDKGPPRGISGVTVKVESSSIDGQPTDDRYLDVAFAYRPTEKQPTTDGVEDGVRSVVVRAACQVGPVRFVDVSESSSSDGSRTAYSATPFIRNDLRGAPSLCDLQFYERLARTPQKILHLCHVDGKTTPGACPPATVDGPGTSGFSVPSFDIEVVEAANMSAEHLVLSYTVRSHQKPDLGTLVRVAIDCPGDHDDEEEHPEGGALEIGEGFAAANNKLGAEVPPPDAACTVTFSSVEKKTRAKSVIQQFCYVRRAVNPGPCPPA